MPRPGENASGRSHERLRDEREEPATLTGVARLANWWRRVAAGPDRPAGWDAVAAGALVLLSIPYGILAAASLWLRSRRPARFDVPVISVGNLVAGGAGKTPLTVYLARLLRREGLRVAVVSRGYGRSSKGTVVVSSGGKPEVKWRDAGDEPYMMALLLEGVSIVVSERRRDGVKHAVEALGSDAILLDDAFQHVQLARDLDIVAVDASRPVGNGHLLPGGPLREHPSGVGRAHVLVATRCDRAGSADRVVGALAPLAPGAIVVETRMKPIELWDVGTGETVGAAGLREKKCMALSSIADPLDFERTLARVGMNVVGRLALPDHHDYSGDDVEVVVEAAREIGANAILTTEKDAVRLRPWRSRVPLVALGIDLEVVAGEEQLLEVIRETVSGRRNQ
jgi:tetraacyldisaccharide 4'-kinase